MVSQRHGTAAHALGRLPFVSAAENACSVPRGSAVLPVDSSSFGDKIGVV